jgi:SET domain-containing protein
VIGEKMLAARDIQADEEILVDYQTFDDNFDSYKHILK